MNKTALQMFEERNEKECCLNCEKLIVKHTKTGHIKISAERVRKSFWICFLMSEPTSQGANMQERSQPMIKTWFKEYEKIKDKAVVVYPYEWDCMSEKQRNKILSKKTVIMSGESGYACKYYEIIGNVNNLSDHDCAILADGGNLCFGYRMEGQRIVVYTD